MAFGSQIPHSDFYLFLIWSQPSLCFVDSFTIDVRGVFANGIVQFLVLITAGDSGGKYN